MKYWRDRALQAEARLADRDRQDQKQNAEILDLSWKAKVAEDWALWWETHSEAYTRRGTRPRDFAGPSPSTERRSRSRSASTSVTCHGPKCYPTQEHSAHRNSDTERTSRQGAARSPGGRKSQEVEELREYQLDSFESQPEPNSQIEMTKVITASTAMIWSHASRGLV